MEDAEKDAALSADQDATVEHQTYEDLKDAIEERSISTEDFL